MWSILAVAVLLATGAVALRVLLKPPVLREILARPLVTLAAAAGAVATLIVVAPRFPRRDLGLPVLATVMGGLALVAHRRARPEAGRGRGLPPGSLGLGVSLDALTDIGFYAKAARRWGPVFKMSQFHRPVVCIVDLPLGLRVMESERANLAQPRLPFGRLSPGDYIEFMNDERHARYRGILRPALGGSVIAEARPGVDSVVRHQLSAMAGPDGGRTDPLPFLERIAIASLLRVMFGVAVDDPRVEGLTRSFDQLGSPRAFAERRPEERREPFSRLIAIVREVGREMLAAGGRPGPSPRSALGEILRADQNHLADDTLIGNLVLMVYVTRSNIRGLLGWILKEYCDHPEWAARLSAAADPAAAASIEALATNFVNETLRMHQSEYFYREVVRDITIGGFRIPRGWLVRVCVRECHDRPDLFPNPDRFDPSRFADRHFDRTEYCPFSDGSHSCFGAGLAVMIAKSFVLVLASGFDARTTADGPVERQGNRHWSHWRPSLAFRVALTPRVPPEPADRKDAVANLA